MKSDSFFKSKFFLMQLLSAIIIAIVFLWLILFCLRIYTHHGQKISVPDLYGQSPVKYKKTLNDTDLRYVIMDSVYRPNLKESCVVIQTPKAGSIVKEDRIIYLTVSTTKAEKVLFPKLIDNSFRQAVDVLRTNGFSIGKLEYQAGGYFNLVQEARSEGLSINYKDLVIKGSTIDLVLGLGSVKKVVVPNLFETTLSNSKDEILFSNLNIGQVKFDTSVQSKQDILNARVWQQKPRADMYLKPGELVHIWLTCDSLRFKPVVKEEISEQ